MSINVLLKTNNIPQTLTFYKNIGFEEKMWLKKNDVQFYTELYYKNDINYVLMFLHEALWDFDDYSTPIPHGAGMVIYIPVKNIEAEYNRLCNNGCVVRKLTHRYYGNEFVLQDPYGYKVAIFQEHESGEKLLPGMEMWKK